MQQQQQQQQQQQNDEAGILGELADKDIGAVSDKDLEALLSGEDLGSFAESLLKQIQGDMGDIGKFIFITCSFGTVHEVIFSQIIVFHPTD